MRHTKGRGIEGKSDGLEINGDDNVKKATAVLMGGNGGLNMSDSDEDWGIELGDATEAGIMEVEPNEQKGSGSGSKQIKNEKEAIQKTMARVNKLLADIQKAKLTVKGALMKEDSPHYAVLKNKLGGSIDVMNSSIDHFESLSLKSETDWQYLDLAQIKKHAAADIAKINTYITTVKALG